MLTTNVSPKRGFDGVKLALSAKPGTFSAEDMTIVRAIAPPRIDRQCRNEDRAPRNRSIDLSIAAIAEKLNIYIFAVDGCKDVESAEFTTAMDRVIQAIGCSHRAGKLGILEVNLH